MKKIIGLIVLIFVFSLSFNMKAKAAEPTIAVSNVKKAEAGDKVNVDFTFQDNPGIAAFSITVEYDDSALELEEIKHSGISSGTWMISDNNISWFSFGDSKYNGKFATAVFNVKDGASAGKSKVTISYQKGNICNFDEEIVNFKIQDGSINIESSKTDKETTQDKESKKDSEINKDTNTKQEDSEELIKQEESKLAQEIEQEIKNASEEYNDDTAEMVSSKKQSSSLVWLWIVLGVIAVIVVLYFIFRDKISFLRRKK